MRKYVMLIFLLPWLIHAESPEEQTDKRREKPHHCHNPACPYYSKEDEKPKQSEKELQQMAIVTLANMAQGVLNIGWDPHNPTNVAQNVTNIVGTFAGFVANAMIKYRVENIDALLENEEFLEELTALLTNKAKIFKKKHQEE